MEYFTGKVIIQPPGGRGMGLARIGNSIPSHSEGLEITDLDPEGVGSTVFPRSIEVQTNDADGAKQLALWHGDFGLQVGDFVRCRKDPSSPILIIEGLGGDTAAKSTGVWPEPTQVRIGTVSYATLALAAAAAVSGDTIILGANSHTVNNVTIPDGVKLKGTGRDTTILTTSTVDYVLTVASGSTITVEGLTIRNTYGTGYTGAVTCAHSGDNGATTTWIDCRMEATGAGTGNNGFGVTNGTHTLINCEVVSSGATDNYGLVTAHSGAGVGTINTYGGLVNGGTADLYTVTISGTINCYNTRLVNDTRLRFFGNGTINVYSIITPEPEYNPIINGGLNVWQRGTSFAAVANLDFTADRFRYLKQGAMVHTISQSTDVPTVAQAGQLANYSLLVDCTTVDSSIATGDRCAIRYVVEGYDWLRFAQVPFWLSFWVKATKTGTYCVGLINSGSALSYVAEYTVNTTATWEYKELYILASPSSGTWDYINGAGVNIHWALAAGSSWQTTANAWNAANAIATSNQVNATDSTANDWRIWGIKMGRYRSPFTRLGYQQELARAQRYYWQATSEILGYGFATSTTNCRVTIPTPVEMRTSPTVNTVGFVTLRGNATSVTITAVSVLRIFPAGITMDLTVASGLTVNQGYTVLGGATAAAFDASL